jgi:hypothetical protein
MKLENAGLLHPNLFRVLWITAIIGLACLRFTRFVQPWGSKVALIALALVLVYWGGLSLAHRSAFSEAQAIARKLSVERGETLGRVAAMPVLADPFRWLCVADTDQATYRFLLSLTGGDDKLVGEVARFVKPQGAEAVAAKRASNNERAQIFLNFARFPASRIEGDCLSGLLVQFADIRYTEPGALRRGTFSLEVPVACDAEMVNEK